MTQNLQGVHQSTVSTQEFLVSRTDSSISSEKAEKRAHTGVFIYSDILKEELKDILIGEALIESTEEWYEDLDSFGVLIIKLDDCVNPAIQDKDKSIDTYISVAKSIAGVSSEGDRLWGQIGDDLFACFFPETEDTVLIEKAERLKQDLAGRCSNTISIGTASYPTITYNKDQILENAKKAVDHAAFFGPDSTVSFDSVSLNISGDKLYQKGDIDEAVSEFETALFLDANDVNVRNSLGVCYGVMGLYDKALEQFDEVVRLDPEEIMAIYNKGHVNLLTGNKEKALEIFLSAGNPGETIYELVFEIGKIYIEKGMHTEGKEYIEKALLLKPDSGPAFRYLGECFEANGKTNEAIEVYKKAVKQNPGDAFSLSALGYLFEISGENVEIATMFCRQSVDISPEKAIFRYRLGRLYYKQGIFENALMQFKRAEELGYDSSEFIKEIQEQID